MCRLALEIGAIGQDRQAGGAALCISAREAGWIEIRADHARTRRCLLDFGDQPVMPGLGCVVERGDEAARRRRFARGALHLTQGPRPFGARDLGALAVAKGRQNVAHAAASGALVIATSFSSERLAAPEAIDLAPIAT